MRIQVVPIKKTLETLSDEISRIERKIAAAWKELIEGIDEPTARKSCGEHLEKIEGRLAKAKQAKARNKLLRRIFPFWPQGHHERIVQSLEAEIQLKIHGAKRAIASRASKRSKAITSLISRHKEYQELRFRLLDLQREQIHGIRLNADMKPAMAIAEALHYAPITSSVLPVGVDTSVLNLSPRSRVASIGVAGLPMTPQRDERQVILEINRNTDGLPGWQLLGRTWANWPVEVNKPRLRSAIPLLPGSYSTRERFYLPVPPTMIEKVVAAGASMGRRGGFYVDLGLVDLSGVISSFLPFIAQPYYRPLPVTGIPRSSWGMSLAGLLSKSSWDAIRQDVFIRYGGLCQICGQLRGGQNLECHEIWDFIYDDFVSGMRRQRLVSLACLCRSCHGAMHQGYSEATGRGDSAAYRLADINGWSMDEAETIEQCVRTDMEHRNRSKWFLDLSLLGNRLLTLDVSKVEESDGILRRKDGKGAPTRLLGATYRIGAKGMPRRHREDRGTTELIFNAA